MIMFSTLVIDMGSMTVPKLRSGENGETPPSHFAKVQAAIEYLLRPSGFGRRRLLYRVKVTAFGWQNLTGGV